jgi:outer membrane immunogenic protein
MKPILASAVAVGFLFAIDCAGAADLVSEMPTDRLGAIYDWTGLYVGLNGGGVSGLSKQSQVIGSSLTMRSSDLSGGLAGAFLGFDSQIDRVVFGLEGDFDWAHIRASANCIGAVFACSTTSDYLGTVRGLLGFSLYRWMPYVTVGAAFGDIKEALAPTSGASDGAIANRVGWTIGGGVKYFLGYGWSLKVEYLHVDLGTFICGISCSGAATRTLNTVFTEEVFRAGLGYRF